MIRPEISEQIENTTDLPVSKLKLMARFHDLRHQISSLPDAWWHRHPSQRAKGSLLDPERDAELLHSLNGQEPASESKETLRRRVRWFFEWLFRGEQRHFDNIAVYSHCCTIFEMERFLRGFDIADDSQHHESLTMPQNTEIRSFELLDIADDAVAQLRDDRLRQDFDGYYTPHAPATTRVHDTAHAAQF